jgi:hypothetical protein
MNDFCCRAHHLLTSFLLYVSFGFREVVMTTQPNKKEFWTWKCHISTTNRTPELNEVSLESSGIILLCWEGKLPIQWALETLKVKTKAPWQPKTKQNKFWTWKCHISTNNRTPESNEVSLKSSCILLLCCGGRVTNSMGFGDSQGWDNGAMTTQPNKSNFELESATSPPPIRPLSWMRYHWKVFVF